MLMLNCDLGESFGSWKMGRDDEVMPHIDQANIACGFHGGDPLVMEKTLAMAKQNGTKNAVIRGNRIFRFQFPGNNKLLLWQRLF